MKKISVIYYIVLAVILILLQVTIFSNIALWGVATPFLFIYIIMKLPVSMSTNKVMTIATTKVEKGEKRNEHFFR